MSAVILLNEDKRALGEALYSKIQTFHPSLAPKLTGMLLELDISLIRSLLTCEERLAAKVYEAKQVWEKHVKEKLREKIPSNKLVEVLLTRDYREVRQMLNNDETLLKHTSQANQFPTDGCNDIPQQQVDHALRAEIYEMVSSCQAVLLRKVSESILRDVHPDLLRRMIQNEELRRFIMEADLTLSKDSTLEEEFAVPNSLDM